MRHWRVSMAGWVLFVALLAGGCSSKGTADDGGACPAFRECAGVVDGSWQLDSVCVDAEVSAAFRTRWPQASCSDAIRSSTLSMTGTLTFAGGSSTRHVTTSQTWRGIYSIPCMSEMQGTTVAQVDTVQCFIQQGWLEQPDIFTSVSCGILDQSCDCNMSYSATDSTTVPYTIQESTIVFSDGTPSAAFCSRGDTLMLRQADPVSGSPLIVVAHRI